MGCFIFAVRLTGQHWLKIAHSLLWLKHLSSSSASIEDPAFNAFKIWIPAKTLPE